MSRNAVKFVRLSVKGFKGFVRQDLMGIFTGDFLGDIEAAVCRAGGRIINDSRVRWVALFSGPGGHALFIKKFRVKNWNGRLKHLLLASTAMKEWDVSLALWQKGVKIPTPVGVMEKTRWRFLDESLYVSEAIEGAQSLMDSFVERFGKGDLKGGEEKRRIARLLGDTVRHIHDKGLFHADLHAGNFLIKKTGETELYLIDLHRARVRKNLSGRQRLWDIAHLFYSLNSILDRGDKGIFLQAYGGNGKPFEAFEPFLMSVERLVHKLKRRHQKRWVKRCLRESSLFTSHRWEGYGVYRRRDVFREALLEMIDAHRKTMENYPLRLLKNSPQIVVSMVEIPRGSSRRTCVKQFRYVTVWSKIKECFRYSKGKVSWVAANELFRQRISDLKPLAYVEKRRLGFLKESFFIMESPTDYLGMDQYLIKSFGNGRSGYLVSKERAFIRQFARWMGCLHQSGIYHRDLKTCNILVREKPGGWSFSLIDLEDVIQGAEIGIEKILRNMVQINSSVPGFFRYGDRIRFLKGYLKANPVAIDERAFIREVLEEDAGGE